MGSRLLLMGVALAISNYFCQAVGPHDWAIALDRSFFQGCALLWVWLDLKFDRSISVSAAVPSDQRGSGA